MQDNMKLCPLKATAPEAVQGCTKARCALWDASVGGCAVFKLVADVQKLDDIVGDIANHVYQHQHEMA